MTRKLLLTTLACAALFTTAHRAASQALATATGPGSYVAVGGGLSSFNTDYGRQRINGGVVYLDVHPQWRVGMEGEARFLRWNAQQQVSESNYLGGLRVSVWPNARRWSPYTKLLAGAGEITLPYRYAHGGFLTYAPGAGLDVFLTDRITVRACDLEYQHWPKFTYGALSPYGFSTGLSFRLNSVSRYPRGDRARR